MANSLKKDLSKTRSIDWLWNANTDGKGIRVWIRHAIHQYVKTNNKIMNIT